MERNQKTEALLARLSNIQVSLNEITLTKEIQRLREESERKVKSKSSSFCLLVKGLKHNEPVKEEPETKEEKPIVNVPNDKAEDQVAEIEEAASSQPVAIVPNDAVEPQVISEDQKYTIGTILDRLINEIDDDGMEIGQIFTNPVDRDLYPDYYKVIENPLCFEDMKEKLEVASYATISQVTHDLALIFHNALVYNMPGTKVPVAAIELRESAKLEFKAMARNGMISVEEASFPDLGEIAPVVDEHLEKTSAISFGLGSQFVNLKWMEDNEVQQSSFHYTEYFGEQMKHQIEQLHRVKPLQQPSELAYDAFPWQLKGASQAIYLCQSHLCGGIIGDEMGLGKTLTAILAMWKSRDQPGAFSMVVCPGSTVSNWAREINRAFKPGKEMRFLVLDDPKATPSGLLDLEVEIIICTYEFIETNWRHRRQLPTKIAHYRPGHSEQPKRSRTIMHSDIWSFLNLPIKLLVLDEAHKIKNLGGKRFAAIQNLFYSSILMLTGTYFDNIWQDIRALIFLLKGHPFPDKRSFNNFFMPKDYEGKRRLTNTKAAMLIRFLQTFLIHRPGTLMTLPGIRRYQFSFDLEEKELFWCDFFCLKHEWATILGGDPQQDEDEGSALGAATKAQRASTASCLIDQFICEEINRERDQESNADVEGSAESSNVLYDEEAASNDDISESEESEEESLDDSGDGLLAQPEAEYVPGKVTKMKKTKTKKTKKTRKTKKTIPYVHPSEEKIAPQPLPKIPDDLLQTVATVSYDPNNRESWLGFIESDDTILKAARITAFLRVYDICREAFPDEKIVVASKFVNVLDLFYTALRKKKGVNGIRYDGLMSTEARDQAQLAFAECKPEIPLFLSADAGGLGISLTAGSVLIQDSDWWNANTEGQVGGRLFRTKQSRVVKIIKLRATNSSIERKILGRQLEKSRQIEKLQKWLVCRHDEEPRIPPINNTIYTRALDKDELKNIVGIVGHDSEPESVDEESDDVLDSVDKESAAHTDGDSKCSGTGYQSTVKTEKSQDRLSDIENKKSMEVYAQSETDDDSAEAQILRELRARSYRQSDQGDAQSIKEWTGSQQKEAGGTRATINQQGNEGDKSNSGMVKELTDEDAFSDALSDMENVDGKDSDADAAMDGVRDAVQEDQEKQTKPKKDRKDRKGKKGKKGKNGGERKKGKVEKTENQEKTAVAFDLGNDNWMTDDMQYGAPGSFDQITVGLRLPF